jgi:methylenetetrahydrofolate reductase (NADPH)
VTRAKLAAVAAAIFFCDFGAGGTTQQGTLDTVLEIRVKDAALRRICLVSAADRAILRQYQNFDIRRVVALRGDLPSGYGMGGEFRYASDLVEFIRAETGNWFHIEVAAYPEMHPQARSPQDDVNNFVRKVKAGANSAIPSISTMLMLTSVCR